MDAPAPIIYFDGIDGLSLREGVAGLTLAVRLYRTEGANRVATPHDVPAVHLRCAVPALQALKQAIEQLELLAQQAASAARN
jgi:hypothetical protein